MAKKPKKKKAPKKIASFDTETNLDQMSTKQLDSRLHAQYKAELEVEIMSALASMANARTDWVSTRCGKCNLKLNQPRAEATRCILCGNKELEISK